jgi:predicted nucleic acid-binding protein
MNDRFFLDTNLFVYTFDVKTPAKARKAAQLIRRAADTGQGIISYQVVQEFFRVAFRRFAQPMSFAEAEQYLVLCFVLCWLCIHHPPFTSKRFGLRKNIESPGMTR